MEIIYQFKIKSWQGFFFFFSLSIFEYNFFFWKISQNISKINWIYTKKNTKIPNFLVKKA